MSYGFGRINDLAFECHKISKDHGFWEQSDNIPEKLMLIVSELSEALEDYRVSDTKHMGEELADACIRIFDLSEYLKINIEQEIVNKMEKNKERPYLHGNKRA